MKMLLQIFMIVYNPNLQKIKAKTLITNHNITKKKKKEKKEKKKEKEKKVLTLFFFQKLLN